MAEHKTDVLVAGYQSIEKATEDFDALLELVKTKQVEVEGVILITHAEDGTVDVQQTGDNLGRKGMGWGGGVGLAVGLAAPPLLAATAVGAVAGGAMGKFVDHRVETGLHDKIGENLPPGSAGIIAVFDDRQRLAVEQALPGSPMKSVVQSDKKGIKALKDGLAEAMQKFVPDRTVLPIPDRPFGGTLGRTIDKSVGDWSIIPGPKAPENAPNVLLVLIDDAGFGAPDTFGGGVSTPNLTRVGEMGVTYNRFHVTAVCSPTRAALLTGRNHHRVGMGSIAELPGPYPGYTGERPRSCTAFPRILRENGYVTAGFGKWHLTPGSQMGQSGPFDHWPLSWGFDHWYGFLTGAAGQYDPIITIDNSTVGVPEGENGELYYFPDAFTDKSIEWLHAVRATDAHKPWMMYYSTGCAHAPHHVGKEWADRYKGAFDQGWDAYREETLARQKKLGIVPEDTELTERPDLFPAWDSLNEAEKKLYARQMEVVAGYQENADWNVGRLLDAIEEMGDLDNTLVIYIWGDNGASMEGTTTGSFNETTFFNGVILDADEQLEIIEKFGGVDALGGFHTAPHYAAAWAHASNTPFQWGKQMGATWVERETRWSFPGRSRSRRPAASGRSSRTASTLGQRSSSSSGFPSRRWSTGSRRSRWTARASRTRSTMRRLPSSTPCSTSRCWVAGRCTRTAGGPVPSSTRFPGTSRPRRCNGSRRASTTPSRTPGSCTTSRTTSRRRGISRWSIRRSSRS